MKQKKIALLTIILIFVSTFAQSAIVADYLFNNNLQSSVAGASDLVDLGSGSYESATVDGQTKTVMRYAAGTGFQFDTTGLISNDVYTIAILVAIDDNSSYVKLADFDNLVTDVGFYNFNGQLAVYNQLFGGNVVINNNQYHQIILSRNTSDLVEGYVDGQLEISFTDTPLETEIGLNNLIHFLIDDRGLLENSDGRLARITVFNTALSQAEVSAFPPLPAAATPALIPTLSPIFMALLFIFLLTLSYKNISINKG